MISFREFGGLLSLLLLASGFYLSLARCQFILSDANEDFTPDSRNIYQSDQPSDGQVVYGDVYEGQRGPYYESLPIEANQNKLIDQITSDLLGASSDEPSEPLEDEQTGDGPASSDRDLLELLENLKGQRKEKRQNPGYYHYDVNSHLPATSLEPDDDNGQYYSLSRPVNDPEEFEAKLGQLTDALNHNMANTAERQHLLMGLLNQSRNELDLADDLGEPVNSISSISQLEIDQLVNRLDQWLDDQTTKSEKAERGAERQQDEGDSEGPSTRYNGAGGGSEYIDHPLALAGHQFVQGGAGEGRQLLGPDGTYENVQVIKTDAAIPSYCDPPNPCPLGYTAKDGCLEEFVNSASFSREYQAQQKCSCDNEHSLFNCAAPVSQQQSQQQRQSSKTDSDAAVDEGGTSSTFDLGNKLDTLARTIQNRFGDLSVVQKLVGKQGQQRQEQDQLLGGNDDLNSDYLIRSARKLSALDMHHKVNLD